MEITTAIINFLNETNTFHWLWTMEGIAKVSKWASDTLGLPFKDVIYAMMNVSSEMYHSTDPIIVATKPDSVKEAEKIIDDMENNTTSIHRQNYEIEEIGISEPHTNKKQIIGAVIFSFLMALPIFLLGLCFNSRG